MICGLTEMGKSCRKGLNVSFRQLAYVIRSPLGVLVSGSVFMRVNFGLHSSIAQSAALV